MTIFNESLADGLKIGEHPGRIFHVSKHASASDSNDGSNATTKAWATIQKAATTMIAGDITEVHTGTYTERVTTLNEGASDNRITLRAHGTDVVTIDGTGIGGGNSSNGLVYISAESYWTIDGFIIQDAASCSGVALYGECHGVTLQNLTIQNCDVSGIHATYDWGAADPTKITALTIDNCETYNTNLNGDQEAISLINVGTFEIKNCKVHDTPNDANNKEGIDCKMGCINGSIHDNECYNVKEGIYIDPSNGASDNIDIYNNSLHDCRDAGIYLNSEGTSEALTDCVIWNNLIYNNEVIGFQVSPTGTKTYTFINNTLYGNASREICIYAAYALNIDCVIRNNIAYSTLGNSYCVLYSGYSSGGVTIEYNCWYNSGGGFNTSSKKGTDYIEANPMMVNPAGANFMILATSPCVNAGDTTDAPATDYAGSTRDASPDIGAYEYQASGGRMNKIRFIPGMKDLFGGGF